VDRRIHALNRCEQDGEAEVVVEDLLCALSDCAGSDDFCFGRQSRDSNVLGFWKSDD
jgi:hypothetical protein